MRTVFLWLALACCPSISLLASEHPILQSLITDLDQNVEPLVLKLNASGYEENIDKAFQQAGLRVFMKADKGTRPTTYILEQCGNQITGYSREITSMESLLLAKELKTQGYKKLEKDRDRYRKNNINVELYADDSHLLLARHYIYVSRKNSCQNNDLAAPLAPVLNLRPTTLDIALANMKHDRTAIKLAAAKIAFTEFTEKETADSVCYKKAQQTFMVKFCNNNVRHFELQLNAGDGSSLVASVEKTNFHKIKDDTAANNAYCRTYDNGTYEVTVYYYGDKYGREFNENAYKIELLDKQSCL
ncbi:hypothetical protein [Flavisolibacter tropicus]|uniref:Uncharacterized protein n=1 Tax=Flavisolibacter tropicus TaxID=1492898 RepID=A0A172TX66_9BACT|nr:hypothetical protein [Flavisolibacter tropicus]ANE51558.1 hypothetical protein SY85_14650 [Flavisolibacter tropicus]